MARDLIPPSSPAGRPAPDGAPNLIELPPEPPRSAAEPPMREPVGPSEFRNRFGFLLGALAGIFIAAALVGIVVYSTREDGPLSAEESMAPNWSAWQPQDRTMGGAVEIAKKISGEYRGADGRPIVAVTAGLLESRVVLRGPSGITDLVNAPGVTYEMDGLGPLKSIRGEGSEERFQLIQREALELALYTFRYLPEVQQVVTKLPPPPPTEEQKRAAAKAELASNKAQAAVAQAQSTGKETDIIAAQSAIAEANKYALDTVPDKDRRAIFYRPGDLKQQLQSPLSATLPGKVARPGSIDKAQLDKINALTAWNMFAWSNPDPARSILMLDR
jgi:hypothetical protein